MNKFAKAFHRGEKGFTLIELLIVIVILGILSAVAIPQVTKFIASGKTSAAKSELALVQTAVGAAMADAQVTTMTVGGLSVTGALGHLVDCEVADAAASATGGAVWVSDYIQGTVTGHSTSASNLPIKGTYTISAAGVVTQTATGQ